MQAHMKQELHGLDLQTALRERAEVRFNAYFAESQADCTVRN